MEVAGSFGDAMVPVPETSVQVPVAGKVMALPAMVVLVTGVHKLWSGPAFADGTELLNTDTLTSSWLTGAQGPLLTVHRNTFTPTPRLLMAVVGEEGFWMLPWPLTRVHVPVPGAVIVLPAMVVLVVGVHSSWSGPAFAVGTFWSKTWMVT